MNYIIYWTIMIVMQVPCNINVRSEYSNDQCYVNDTIYINKQMAFDSLDNAIRWDSRLRFIQERNKMIDEIVLSEIGSCPKVLIDTIWNNNLAEVYQIMQK